MEQFNKPRVLLMTGNVAENYKDFVRDIKIFFAATETDGKPEPVQVARLKNLMGEDALNQYSARTTVPGKEETVDKVLGVLAEICLPKKNEIWDVYQFFNRKQQMGESFDSFYSALKKLVKSCAFDKQEDKLLKVQIVLGVQSKNVQQRLLREDMSLDKIVDYCKSVENAERKAQVLCSSIPVNQLDSRHMDSQEVQVHLVDDKKMSPKFLSGMRREFRSQSSKQCPKCGWFHGSNEMCPAGSKRCNTCNEMGHFSRMCDKKLLSSRNVYEVVTDDSEYILNVDTVTRAAQTHQVQVEGRVKSWMKQVSVNDYPIEFKLDTVEDGF
uniref:CCHC-type domain-containing protein n=1 Tax=Cacopsylla melanoneura TaxID=428564 RepID=A0A8D8SZ70_9HEMI